MKKCKKKSAVGQFICICTLSIQDLHIYKFTFIQNETKRIFFRGWGHRGRKKTTSIVMQYSILNQITQGWRVFVYYNIIINIYNNYEYLFNFTWLIYLYYIYTIIFTIYLSILIYISNINYEKGFYL